MKPNLQAGRQFKEKKRQANHIYLLYDLNLVNRKMCSMILTIFLDLVVSLPTLNSHLF